MLAAKSDGLVTTRVGVECKAWAVPIEKDVVAKLSFVVSDLGLNKGMVGARRSTPGCQQFTARSPDGPTSFHTEDDLRGLRAQGSAQPNSLVGTNDRCTFIAACADVLPGSSGDRVDGARGGCSLAVHSRHED